MANRDLQEKNNPQTVVIIGASGGIGLGFVRYFLEQIPFPVKIWATYRQAIAELEDLARENPDRLTLAPLDITEESQIEQFSQQLGKTEVNWLINCVGILHIDGTPPEKSLRHLRPSQLQQYFAVNSIGPVLLAKHFLSHFRHSSPSVFATISAKVGSIGDNQLGGWYGYRSSKTALNMLMKNTAIEYRRVAPQCAVILLHPGTTNTPLSQPFQKNVPPEKLFTVERTVQQLMAVLLQVKPEDTGTFYSWDGTVLPW
ncbi:MULTISPECIES: SDR family NAD(P)-dependent oxidoreductase [unclassified Synechocystis]|uniref:SDR family NAD(P)-dependent oxidoreductase n=1 Tax=unclassified Synechocystis TaxID=2640012 RepID=UPI0003FCB129|nr:MULTISPECIES: SDR family NAD(P)-dependent oxidoreductase [unclassified Synechocystis]AIE72559.1 Cell-cell signaling protein, C-factor [Synechocystis sp. PCC 6714]MCT0254477.1 SDR family NAD(P)-dependent oxidoreductase [Synechocystis sp. CS-94]